MSGYKTDRQADAQSLEYSLPPGFHVSVSRTNEVWQGKNDPTERRRIQNRINQRAFRSRQRAGEQTKSTKPRRSTQSRDASENDSTPEASPHFQPARPVSSPPRSDARASVKTCAEQSNTTLLVWDELGHLINRNFVAATLENARMLGIHSSLLGGKPIACTPSSAGRTSSASLAPVRLQFDVPHDLIIDTIPHCRLRYNIVRAIASGKLDQTSFTQSLRKSGMLRQMRDNVVREGLIVWGSADDCRNWEMSELFFRQWNWLLEGCDDLIGFTNAWRSQRGYTLFPSCTPIKQE